MIGAAIRKDVILLVRDRGALASLLLLPLAFIAVFGTIFQGDSADQPVTIAMHVPQAASKQALAVVGELKQNPAFLLHQLPTIEQVRQEVTAGASDIGIVLPTDFSPFAGVPGRLIFQQGIPPQRRLSVVATLTELIARVCRGGEPVELLVQETAGAEKEARFAGGFQVAVPGNAVLFCFFLSLTVALSFLEDRRSGVFRRLLAAPISRAELLLAKLIPYLFVGLFQMLFLFGVGTFVFGMDLGNNVLALLILTIAVVLCAVSMGLLIASFGGSAKQVGSIGSICLLVMSLLGGAMVPRTVMPSMMQTLGLGTPHGWALEGYYDLLLRGQSALGDVLFETMCLLGFAIAFAAVGIARFRFE